MLDAWHEFLIICEDLAIAAPPRAEVPRLLNRSTTSPPLLSLYFPVWNFWQSLLACGRSEKVVSPNSAVPGPSAADASLMID
jgi:hypothetical protein